MWIFFKRLFNVGKAKAHAKLDKVEDPVALTEQSIKDLKQDLAESMKSLAEMKALAIRTKRDVQQAHRAADQYEQRAMQFIGKAEQGDITMDEADRYALKALGQKDQILRVSSANEQNLRAYENMIRKLEIDIQKIRTQINTWEGELKTLKVRSRLSETSRRLNERMSSLSKNSMSDMLDDMKMKVEEQEALAQSYEDIAINDSGSLKCQCQRDSTEEKPSFACGDTDPLSCNDYQVNDGCGLGNLCTIKRGRFPSCPGVAACGETITNSCGEVCSVGGACDDPIVACTDTTWEPSESSTCSGETFTQTSNCGTSRSQIGTKDCSVSPPPACTKICLPGEGLCSDCTCKRACV